MLATLTLQDNGVPIYVQLRDQIAAAIGRGDLRPGERLPTMREVAVALARGMGVEAERARDCAEFARAFDDAMKRRGPRHNEAVL